MQSFNADLGRSELGSAHQALKNSLMRVLDVALPRTLGINSALPSGNSSRTSGHATVLLCCLDLGQSDDCWKSLHFATMQSLGSKLLSHCSPDFHSLCCKFVLEPNKAESFSFNCWERVHSRHHALATGFLNCIHSEVTWTCFKCCHHLV